MDHEQSLSLYREGKKLYDLVDIDFINKRFKNVVFVDWETVYVWLPSGLDSLHIGAGSVIGPHVYFFGETHIGEHTMIQPGTRLTRSTIGSRCNIGGHIIDACIGSDVATGPNTEITRSTIMEHVTAKHFCYLGDTKIGRHTNIGASTITANYDGIQKNKTVIGEHVKTGIHSNLVSTQKNNKGALRIGDGAIIGANAIITQDVPAGAVVVGLNNIIQIREVYE